MFDAKPDKAKRKVERTLKEEKAKKKSRIITTTVIIVFILFLSLAMVINSNWIRRTLPVITIDGISFSTAEFEYYFNAQYIEYLNFMSQFQGMGVALPDQNRPLSSQIYDPETGETWADIIAQSAYSRMQGLVGLYNLAVEHGFELSEEHYDNIEYEILILEMEAEMMPHTPSATALLQRMYGNSINVDVFRSILEFISMAEQYSIYIRNSFEYTDQELENYYQENSDDLDIFSFRIFNITAELPAEGTEDYDDAKAEMLIAAQVMAREIADEIETPDDFIDAALAYNDSLYPQPDSTLREAQGERVDELYSSWLTDKNTNIGDIKVFDTEQGAAIVYLVSRNKNDYYTTGMRQILILRDSVSPADFAEGEDDPEYLEALENAQKDAMERAQKVDALFISEGKTEDALLGLMEEHSDDNTPGGFYEGISMFAYQGADFRAMRVVPELEEWLFEEGRIKGDSKLIETEAFGFHLMYFTGFGDKLFSHIIAEDRMRTTEHNEWLDSIIVGLPVKHIGFTLVNI